VWPDYWSGIEEATKRRSRWVKSKRDIIKGSTKIACATSGENAYIAASETARKAAPTGTTGVRVERFVIWPLASLTRN
jgi:hypothetical protein